MSYQSVNEPCSILEQDGKCGETESLAIIKEFKRQYESKMSKIDNEAGGDNLPGLQAKVLLQREWIRDLTAQNELLIRAMEELEKEATERVIMLESRLKHQAEKTNEVMQKYISINLDEIFQNLVYLQSDVRNLLKFIKRIREEDSWNIDGLKFHNITCQDLFGTDCDCSSVCLHEMSSKEKGCSGGPCLDYNKINAELEKNLKEKEKQLVDISAKYNQKCEEAITAKRSLMDVRNALTVEVAEKHDVILNLRRDVQQLEENIRQSNKQILFKDDIIKELRKEIKSFKDEIDTSIRSDPRPNTSFIDSSVMQHECCPYVKEFCPVLKLKSTKSLPKREDFDLDNLNSYKHFNKDINSNINKNGQRNEALIFVREESPTRDYTPKRSRSVEKYANLNLSANMVQKSKKGRNSIFIQHGDVLQSLSSSVDDNWFESTTMKTRKARSKLTATKILHEYYGVTKQHNYDGSCESVNNEIVKRKSTIVPRHVPVKTFVTNLEKQVKTSINEKHDKY